MPKPLKTIEEAKDALNPYTKEKCKKLINKFLSGKDVFDRDVMPISNETAESAIWVITDLLNGGKEIRSIELESNSSISIFFSWEVNSIYLCKVEKDGSLRFACIMRDINQLKTP